MPPQYPCHYCTKREGAVSHGGYWACRTCQRENRDHSQCPPEQVCRQPTEVKP